MSGAALVDDRSGVMFDVELCIPWDAPEAVVDINSAEVVTLGSFPDKVGLFGRRKYLRDTFDRGQSTDAAPLTELLIFYTLLHLYNCCAARSALSWTFCNTVWNNIIVEEITRRW